MNQPELYANTVPVSVIIPLYNVEDLIETTIASLLAQTLHEVEFILIDDGSTDATYAKAVEYARDNPQLRVFHQNNMGPAAARNRGLQLATGDFICFMDSDDFMSEDALEIMYEAALEHEADLVMGRTVRFNSSRMWDIAVYEKHGVHAVGEKRIHTHPGLLYAMGPCAKLYSRKIIEGTFFPEHIRLGEDQPFVLHAYLNAKKIYTVNATVYYYRAREGDNMSLTQRAMQDPSPAFNDLFEMVRITNLQFGIHHHLHIHYLQRVMLMDILPRLRSALKSGDERVQNHVLELMTGWIQDSNRKLFTQVVGLYSYVIIGTLYCFPYLTKESRPAALRLIKSCLRHMAVHNYLFFAKALLQESVNFLRRVLWRSKKRLKDFVKPLLLKRLIFPLAKMSLPFENNKVVFATNRSESLEGNLGMVFDRIQQLHDTWAVLTYTKKDRTFREMIQLYRNLATAKLILLDDYYAPLYGLTCRKETEVIQTWHASGAFKKFGLSAVGTEDSNPVKFELAAHKSYTKVLTTSASIVPQYMEAFGKRRDQVLPIGVPSNDIFFDRQRIQALKRSYIEQFPLLKDKKILLYAPTFRGSPKERVQFNLQLNLEEMSKELGDQYILILKLHPMVKRGVRIPEKLSNFVLNLSSGYNISELLMLADTLITDYSSVVFEYSLLQRPMIFFAYDLDSYLSERGFYYEYRSFVPGPIAMNTGEVIQNVLNPHISNKKLAEFRDFFFGHQDGRALDRFMSEFLEKVNTREDAVSEVTAP